MRGAWAAGAMAIGALALAPVASAQRFHQFYVAGATAHVTAVEDIETASEETGGQNDKAHVEYTLSYTFVKPHGIFTYGTLLVPFSGPAKPARLLSGGAFVKETVTTRASGQTWIRTGGGEDTTGHYATWACNLKPEIVKGTHTFTPVAAGKGRYAVVTQPAARFTSQPDASLCTQSEPGAVPGGGFGISGGAKAARAMQLSHLLTGRELRSRGATLKLGQAFPAAVDCHDGEYAFSCTDTITASGTVKLMKACRKPAQVYGGAVSCDDTLPQPR